MNCLNRYEIQRYIDIEVAPDEMAAFNEHLKICNTCRSLYVIAKDDIFTINQLFAKEEFAEKEIIIPKFKHQRFKAKRRIRIISFSAAASVLLVVGTFLTYNRHSIKSAQFNKSEMEVERYLYQSDPNRLWNEKQPIITITDDKGEIIYSSIND